MSPRFLLGGIKDISSQIKRAEVGGILEPEDFFKNPGYSDGQSQASHLFR